jgi:hypothetical protein
MTAMEPTVATVVDLFGSVHEQLREIVRGLDTDELNWSPGPEMNSAAVLVTHTLGSELDTLLLVRGLTGDRDRDAEFQVTEDDPSGLLAALDRADALLAEHGAAITAENLDAMRERPGRDSQTGRYLLLNNYGHAREHLGHLGLTRQLYREQGA